MAAGTVGSPGGRATSARSYQYTKLKDLVAATTVNVYGIVKFIIPPAPTRGSDLRMMVSIVDDSDSSRVPCLIFKRRLEEFPAVKNVGDIVRIHRLKMSMYNGGLQGQVTKMSSCLVFSGQKDAPLEPETTSHSYTLTDTDKKRVQELRNFIFDDDSIDDLLTQKPTNNQASHCTGDSTLENCKIGQFFNLVCQVVGVCVLVPEQCVMFQIWDGTTPTFPVKEEDLVDRNCVDDLIVDEQLQAAAGKLVFEVQVFDNHAPDAEKIKPGAFLRLTNLHAAQYRCSTSRQLSPAELDLHGGGVAYNRGIQVLGTADPEVAALRERLREVTAGASSPRPQYISSSDETRQMSGPVDSSTNDNSDSEATVTVLTSHHNQPIRCLDYVERHYAPDKFRVRCHVREYLPKPKTPGDIVKLYCKQCHYICPVPKPRSKGSGQPVHLTKENNLDLFGCPQCPGTSKGSSRVLAHTLMLQLLLEDDTGWIVAGLWGPDAETFFHGSPASDVYEDPKVFEFVVSCLQSLSVGSSLADCCLKSYKTSGKVRYQVFDTCVSWSDTDS